MTRVLNLKLPLLLLSCCSFSAVSVEMQSNNQDAEEISFYGGRAVPHAAENNIRIEAPIQRFPSLKQRRSIHPENNHISAQHKVTTNSIIQPKSSSIKTFSVEAKSELTTQPTYKLDNLSNKSNKSNKSKIYSTVNNTVKIVPAPEFSKQKSEITPPALQNTEKTLALSRQDLLLAKKAKFYIERNWNKKTGLIDSVQGYHHTTLWDIASGIAAIIALEHIGLITNFDANSRLSKTLTTMINLPLYNNELPNREYNTQTGLPSGHQSNTASNGNGWSALDIGRLLIWLEITKQYKPELTPLIDLVTDKWQLNRAVNNYTLYGELKTKKSRSYRQEGRVGYLQYAAQGYQFAGLDVSSAFKPDNTELIIQDNIALYIDQRNLPFFTSDSYILQAIELGQSPTWWNQLDSIYQLHKNYYAKNKALRIFSEDAMNRKPWFSYNNINIYGQPWLSTNTQGKKIINPQVFSNKVAFAFSVLFNDEFSQQLADKVVANSLYQRVIPTGLYKNNTINTAYNINTNSLILVSLWFKLRDNKPIYQ